MKTRYAPFLSRAGNMWLFLQNIEPNQSQVVQRLGRHLYLILNLSPVVINISITSCYFKLLACLIGVSPDTILALFLENFLGKLRQSLLEFHWYKHCAINVTKKRDC